LSYSSIIHLTYDHTYKKHGLFIHDSLNLLSHLQKNMRTMWKFENSKVKFLHLWRRFSSIYTFKWCCHVFRFGSWKKLCQSIIQSSPTNFSKVELACGVVMFFFSQANNKKSGWYWLLPHFTWKAKFWLDHVVWNLFFLFKNIFLRYEEKSTFVFIPKLRIMQIEHA
jgi:hypothetical protein